MASEHDNCPSCGADLQGEPIPETYRQHEPDCDGTGKFRNAAGELLSPDRCFCLPYGDKTHFRREIGIELRGVYDGVALWLCPDCGHRWHRFPEGNYYRQRIDRHLAATQQVLDPPAPLNTGSLAS